MRRRPFAWLASLRTRLLILGLLAGLPLLGLITYNAAENRRLARAAAEAEAMRVARFAASQQHQFLTQARQILVELARLPQARRGRPPLCSTLYENLVAFYLQQYPRYANIGAIDRTGRIYCSVTPVSGPVDVAERAYFQRTLQTLNFAIGDYEFDSVTNQAYVNVGYPVLDLDTEVRVVFFVSFNLNWLNQLAAQTELPAAATFKVLDRQGTILVHHPDPAARVGTIWSQVPAIVAGLRPLGQGIVESTDVEGTARLYAFVPLDEDPETSAYVAVGIPTQQVYAQASRQLRTNLAILGLVAVAAAIASWVGSDVFVLRQVNLLLQATRRVSAGDLSARSGLAPGPGEINQLAQAFDEMSATLEQRQSERAKAEAALRESEERLTSLFRDLPFPTCTWQMAGDDLVLVSCNRAAVAITSGRISALAGQPLSTLFAGAPDIQADYRRCLRERRTIQDERLYPMPGLAGERYMAVSYIFVPPDQVVCHTIDLTERKRSEEQIQANAARAEALTRVAGRLNQRLDLSAVATAVCEETAQAMAVPAVVLTLFHEGRQVFDVAAVVGLPANFGELFTPITLAQYEAAVETLGPMLVFEDLHAHPNLVNRDLYMTLGLRSTATAILTRQGRLVGALSALTTGAPHRFSPDDLALMGGLANQAAQAIVNAQLFAETERRADELSALYEITLDLAAEQDLPSVLQTIVDLAVQLLHANVCALFLYDPVTGDLALTVAAGFGGAMGTRVQLWEGAVGRVAQTLQTLLIGDRSDRRGPVPVASGLNLTAGLVVPMLFGGDLIGVLAIGDGDQTPRAYSESDTRLITLIAGHAASAIHNARLFNAEQLARQRAEVLRAASLDLTQNLELEAVLDSLLDYLAKLVPYDSANVMLLDTNLRLAVRAARGYDGLAAVEDVQAITLDVRHNAVLRDMLQSHRSVLIPDTRKHPGWEQLPAGAHVRCWLGVPLMAGGQVFGAYALDKTTPGFFTQEHCRLVEALAAQAAVAIQNARLFEEVRDGHEKLRHLAHQVVMVQEEERQRVSRELHDEAGQALIGLKYSLDIVRADLPLEFDLLHDRMLRATQMIDDTMERIRMLARDLRPPALDAVGLNGVLDDYCLDFQETTRLAVAYDGVDLPGLPGPASTCLYRCLQEALTNVAKHAQAERVLVVLRSVNGLAILSVEDDGQGFDAAAAKSRTGPPTGIGLTGLRERVELLGGRLDIRSEPGEGTRLVVRVPWEGTGPRRGPDGGLASL